MYHSITFGDKNTWDDWHLIPTSRPVIAPPEPKISQIDIPGSDGVLDLSDSLTGYMNYENRTGSIEFMVVNDLYYLVDTHKEWSELYTEIMKHLHGKKMRMVLEDDPGYFYEGRFKVESWESEEHHSKITIAYDVGPYKWTMNSSIDENNCPSIYQNMTLYDEYYQLILDKKVLRNISEFPVFKITQDDPGSQALDPYFYFIFDDPDPERSYQISLVGESVVSVPDMIVRDNVSERDRLMMYKATYPGTISIEFQSRYKGVEIRSDSWTAVILNANDLAVAPIIPVLHVNIPSPGGGVVDPIFYVQIAELEGEVREYRVNLDQENIIKVSEFLFRRSMPASERTMKFKATYPGTVDIEFRKGEF